MAIPATVEEPRAAVPPRLLAALLRAGASEEEIRRQYQLAPDEPIPCDVTEPVRLEDLEWLPEDTYRYELWEGELVRRGASKPRHGVIAGRVVGYLFAYLLQNPIGEVFAAEAGFRSGPGESLYCPDASYVSKERLASVPLDEFAPFAPDVAIEVRSPDNTLRRLEAKADHYLAHGARRVWILHSRQRTVRIHRPDGPVRMLRANDVLSGEEVLPGFAVRVGDLFPA